MVASKFLLEKTTVGEMRSITPVVAELIISLHVQSQDNTVQIEHKYVY